MTLIQNLERDPASDRALLPEAPPTLITLEGMPLVAARPPTSAERWALVIATMIGTFCGGLGGYLLTEPWLTEASLQQRLLFAAAGLPLCAVAYWVAQPALRALVMDQVLEFEGRPIDFGPGNRHGVTLLRDVEHLVVTTPDVKLGLRVNQSWFQLIGGSGSFAKVTNVIGQDTRQLTEAERRELGELARHYGRSAGWGLVPLILAMTVLGFVVRVSPEVLLGMFALWPFLWPFLKVRKLLLADLETGQISGGKLGSGLPWIVSGRPATWRFWRPVPWIHYPRTVQHRLFDEK